MKFKGYQIEKVIKKCTFKGEKTDKYELYKVTGKGIKIPKYYVSMSDAKQFVTNFTSKIVSASLANQIAQIEKKTKHLYC